MEKQCQEDKNFPSGDQVSHNLASSVSVDKTSKQNSTVSSGGGLSPNRTSKISEVSSEIGQTLNEKRKNSSTITAEEISQGDSTTMVIDPRKQLKADSSSSKNCGTMAQLSSVDSADPKPTQSVDSEKALQGPGYSTTTKSDFEFDLNEGMEANEVNWHPKSIHESNYSGGSDVISEPIPVVAKMAVPMGFPEKPLQFGGQRGWKRSCITSAFTPTHHKIRDIKKPRVCRGFDLNIPATVDPDFPVDEACYGPRKMGLDLNYNPNIEEVRTSTYPRAETRQLLRNGDAMGTVTRPQYWVDLSSVQGQPFLLSVPSTEHVQMAVPIQLPYAPPAFYMTYPGNARLMGNSNGMNANAFANMRQTILSNGSIAFVENGRMKAIEQVGFPVSSMKRREPDTGWGSSQINYRQMSSRN